MIDNSLYQTEIARQRARSDVPPGHLAAHRWYLEKNSIDDLPPIAAPVTGLHLTHLAAPDLAIYRTLQDHIGKDWLWMDRRRLDDASLQALIHRPQTAIHVLYDKTTIAGFFEFHLSDDESADINYFGLAPDYAGRRLAPYFLQLLFEQLKKTGRNRATLNTCSLDHPIALAFYLRMGFVIVAEEDYTTPDPRLDGTLPRNAAPDIPLASL